jgi:hypothetical protein
MEWLSNGEEASDRGRAAHVADRRSWLILLGLIALLLVPRFAVEPTAGPFGLDAGFYYQIARHVANGDGPATSVSLYHEGIRTLPQITRSAPLWPLLLGATAVVTGLPSAAFLLPPFLYALSLLLLYVLTERLRWTPDAFAGPVRAGHIAVAIFGTNAVYFAATRDPYTEGLAFCFCFGSLAALTRPSSRWIALAGLLAGLAFTTRIQMVCVGAGAGLALLLARRWRHVLVFSLSAVFPVACWYAYVVARFSWEGRPNHDWRQTPELPGFETWVRVNSFGEWLADRLPGNFVAFDPWSPYSYFASFGAAAALVPIALVIAAWKWRSVQLSVPLAATLIAGLLSHAALVQSHAKWFLPWLFGWRHGLPYVLLIVLSLVVVNAWTTRSVRMIVGVLLVASVATGAISIVRSAAAPRLRYTDAERQLFRWADSQQPRPTLLATNPQYIAPGTRAFLHWTDCSEPASTTRVMLKHLPIDYVVVRQGETRCAFVDDLGDVLVGAGSFEGRDGTRIFLAKPKAAPAR